MDLRKAITLTGAGDCEGRLPSFLKQNKRSIRYGVANSAFHFGTMLVNIALIGCCRGGS